MDNALNGNVNVKSPEYASLCIGLAYKQRFFILLDGDSPVFMPPLAALLSEI